MRLTVFLLSGLDCVPQNAGMRWYHWEALVGGGDSGGPLKTRVEPVSQFWLGSLVRGVGLWGLLLLLV